MSKSIYLYVIITLTKKKDNQFSMMFPFFSSSVFSKKKTSHLFHHLHQSLWCDIKWFTHPNPRTLQPQQWLAKITMAASMPIVCVSKAAIFSVKSFSRNFHDIIILFSFFPPKRYHNYRWGIWKNSQKSAFRRLPNRSSPNSVHGRSNSIAKWRIFTKKSVKSNN